MGINVYGDEQRFARDGFGIDIATQRADDLDEMTLEAIRSMVAVSKTPRSLDIACGAGGQAARMSAAGALVTACDIIDYEEAIAATCQHLSAPMVSFSKTDMRALTDVFPPHGFDILTCQRAIHYLPYQAALAAVSSMATLLVPGGRLFLSASGLESELAAGYSGKDMHIHARYAPLSPEIVARHGIHGPVCLYTKDELLTLMEGAGFNVLTVFASPFGNVKAMAIWTGSSL